MMVFKMAAILYSLKDRLFDDKYLNYSFSRDKNKHINLIEKSPVFPTFNSNQKKMTVENVLPWLNSSRQTEKQVCRPPPHPTQIV